jgi:hypothetical protein
MTQNVVRHINHTEPVKLEPSYRLWVAAMTAVTLERHQVSTASQTLEIEKDIKLVEEFAINLLHKHLTILNESVNTTDFIDRAQKTLLSVTTRHTQYMSVVFKRKCERTRR